MSPSLHTDRRKQVGVARLAYPAASPGDRANAEKTAKTAETGRVANATETNACHGVGFRRFDVTGLEGDDVD